jgi:hypothetical protein
MISEAARTKYDILEAEGVRIARRSADIAILVDCESGDREAVGSHMLLAASRIPTSPASTDRCRNRQARLYRGRR